MSHAVQPFSERHGAADIVTVSGTTRRPWAQRANQITTSIDEKISNAISTTTELSARLDSELLHAGVTEPVESILVADKVDVLRQEFRLKQMEQSLAAQHDANALRKEVFEAFQGERESRRQEIADLRLGLDALCDRFAEELRVGIEAAEARLSEHLAHPGSPNAADVQHMVAEGELRVERQRQAFQEMIMQELTDFQAACEAKILEMKQAPTTIPAAAREERAISDVTVFTTENAAAENWLQKLEDLPESQAFTDMEAFARQFRNEKEKHENLEKNVAALHAFYEREVELRKDMSARLDGATQDLESLRQATGSLAAEINGMSQLAETKTSFEERLLRDMQETKQHAVHLVSSMIDQIDERIADSATSLRRESEERMTELATSASDSIGMLETRFLNELQGVGLTERSKRPSELGQEIQDVLSNMERRLDALQAAAEGREQAQQLANDLQTRIEEALDLIKKDAVSANDLDVRVLALREQLTNELEDRVAEKLGLVPMEGTQGTNREQDDSQDNPSTIVRAADQKFKTVHELLAFTLEPVSQRCEELFRELQGEKITRNECIEEFRKEVSAHNLSQTEHSLTQRFELEERLSGAIQSMQSFTGEALSPIQTAIDARLKDVLSELHVQLNADRTSILTTTTQLQELSMELQADKEARRSSLSELRNELAQHLLHASQQVTRNASSMPQSSASADLSKFEAMIATSQEKLQVTIREAVAACEEHINSQLKTDADKLEQVYSWYEEVRVVNGFPGFGKPSTQAISQNPAEEDMLSKSEARLANRIAEVRQWTEQQHLALEHAVEEALAREREEVLALCSKVVSAVSNKSALSPRTAARFPPPSSEELDGAPMAVTIPSRSDGAAVETGCGQPRKVDNDEHHLDLLLERYSSTERVERLEAELEAVKSLVEKQRTVLEAANERAGQHRADIDPLRASPATVTPNATLAMPNSAPAPSPLGEAGRALASIGAESSQRQAPVECTFVPITRMELELRGLPGCAQQVQSARTHIARPVVPITGRPTGMVSSASVIRSFPGSAHGGSHSSAPGTLSGLRSERAQR